MPSIFDYFNGNGSPEQSAGLIGLAAGFNSALGDGSRPVNLGGALSAGALGMQQAQQGYADREREKQVLAAQAKLLGLKVQDAESDVANQQMLRDRAARIAARLQPQAGAPATSTPGEPGTAGAPANQTDLYIQRMMAVAQAHADEGDVDGANKIYEQLVKLRPKFSNELTWVNGQDDKPVAMRFADDGSKQVVEGIAPRDKVEWLNLDNRMVAASPFAPAGQSFDMGVSPAAQLQANVSMRGQNMTDARAREANQMGKVPPGYRMLSDGSMQAIPGGPADLKAGKEGAQRTQDANDVLSILNEAEPLLKQSTSSYLGTAWDQTARAFGGSTDGAEAAARLKVLQGALVAKMPKMSGPQSDKDVQLYREMAGQIGDSTLPESTRRAAADTVRALNEKYLGMKPGSSRPKTGGGWSITKVGN